MINRSIAGREALRYYFDGQLEISSNAPVRSSVAEIQAFIFGAGFIKMSWKGLKPPKPPFCQGWHFPQNSGVGRSNTEYAGKARDQMAVQS